MLCYVAHSQIINAKELFRLQIDEIIQKLELLDKLQAWYIHIDDENDLFYTYTFHYN